MHHSRIASTRVHRRAVCSSLSQRVNLQSFGSCRSLKAYLRIVGNSGRDHGEVWSDGVKSSYFIKVTRCLFEQSNWRIELRLLLWAIKNASKVDTHTIVPSTDGWFEHGGKKKNRDVHPKVDPSIAAMEPNVEPSFHSQSSKDNESGKSPLLKSTPFAHISSTNTVHHKSKKPNQIWQRFDPKITLSRSN